MSRNVLAEAMERCPTPFYLFDEAELSSQVTRLRTLLPRNAMLCYAMKANPFITGSVCGKVERIEVCSPGELRICKSLGIPANKLVISGVHKDEQFIHELVASSDTIGRYTVESLTQFELLEATARASNVRIPLLLRLTSGNQFGMDAAAIQQLVHDQHSNRFISFQGIQYFSGTQKTSAKRLRREIEHLDSFMQDLSSTYNMHNFELEYGPGLPAFYFEASANSAREHENDHVSFVRELLENMEFKGAVILELGRSIAASCGTYVTRIVDTKRNGEQNYAIVDGGMHQIVYFGNAMAMKQPLCQLMPPRSSGSSSVWNICGSLCTTNDVLVKQLDLVDAKIGDCLAFFQTGAYCMTEGLSLFLSRDLPSVVIADKCGKLRAVRKRVETDLLNTPNLL